MRRPYERQPLTTNHQPESVPYQIGAVEDRAADAGAHVVVAAGFVFYRDDAAVAPAHAAPHDTFHGYLRSASVFCGEVGDRFEHRLRPARIDADTVVRALQLALEWDRHASALARAAVLGGEDQPDAARSEPVDVEELASTPRTVEKRGWRAAVDERFGQCRKRRETDSAGYHPRFCGWVNRLERFAQWTEARNDVAFDSIEQHARGDPHALAEQREP